MKFSLTILFAILIHFGASAQQIQWAESVVNSNGAFEENDWSARMVLGPPNAIPFGELSPRAFRIKNENGVAQFTLSYSIAQNIRQVIIVESFNPGRISRVTIFDEQNVPYVILDGSFQDTKDFNVISIPVPSTDKKFNKVEIRLDASANSGWAQIDAVGISESTDPSIANQVIESAGMMPRFERLLSRQIKRNLGYWINTRFDETKPIISPDGNTLYFGRRFYPGNRGGTNDIQDIYISKKVNGEWGIPVNIGGPINNSNPNGATSVTADGNRLFLINEYYPNGTFNDGFSYSDRINGAWQQPKNIKIDNYRNRNQFLDFALSVNGDVIILAIETANTVGDQDLYVSFYQGNDVWTEPKNLGNLVNSTAAEFSPYLAPDGRTLYFASEGHEGFGKSDIFYTKRLDDTWEVWSEPQNLGPELNTADFDAYFTIPANSNKGFVVSMEGSIGGLRDIYEVQIKPEFLPDPIVTLEGIVTDIETGLPISAEINIQSPNEKSIRNALVSSPDRGGFQAILVQNADYSLDIVAEGYRPFKLPLGPYQSEVDTILRQDFKLIPIKSSLPVELPGTLSIIDQVTNQPISGAKATLTIIDENDSTSVIQLDPSTLTGPLPFNILNTHKSATIEITREGYFPQVVELTGFDLEEDIDLKVNVALKPLPPAFEPTVKRVRLPGLAQPKFRPAPILDFPEWNPYPGKYIVLGTTYNLETKEPISAQITLKTNQIDSLSFETGNDGKFENEITNVLNIEIVAAADNYEPAQFLAEPELLVEDSTIMVDLFLQPKAPVSSSASIIIKDLISQATIEVDQNVISIQYGIDSVSNEILTISNGTYPFQVFENANQLRVNTLKSGYMQGSFVVDSLALSSSTNLVFEFGIMPLPSPLNREKHIAQMPSLNPSIPNSAQKEQLADIDPFPVMLTVIGTVYNESTMELLDVEAIAELIGLESGSEYTKSTDQNASFKLDLLEREGLNFKVTAKGFLAKEGQINLSNEDTKEIETIIYLSPIEMGRAVSIPNLLFAQQEAEILAPSFPVLDSISTVLNQNPNLEILLSGHTDVIGDKLLNMELSQMRAAAVKEYLIGKGISAQRIRVEAFGGSKPIASSGREETRMLNRRVELTIIKN
ncbi:OmpA family protein [Peijinzhouia sedimentorum]